MNVFHLPGAIVGDPRCNCVMCERNRGSFAARKAEKEEAERWHAFMKPCECCGSILGCYCHEYPHKDNPKCPGLLTPI